MDKYAISMLVTETTETAGWKLIKEWVEVETSRHTKRLETIPPEDSVNIARTQATIRSYRYLVDTVEDMKNPK